MATRLAASASLALVLLAPRVASACGGTFAPTESQTSVVTDHRMAFSISSTQTVLWDQIRYNGAPKDFAWVLPVQPGARIELSRDEWLAALDASTVPIIYSPPQSFGGADGTGSGGCSCSGSATNETALAGSASGTSATPPVTVVSQQVVGPYDAVTLHSTNATALNDWLAANGYVIPPNVQPVIDGYVSQKLDFIALRLQPGQNVSSMRPVRVITEGADTTLPLRMVAAGVGANVAITLFVISEGRYHPTNFPDATIDDTQLTWDFSQQQSNYAALSAAAMATNGGRSWLTEYANEPTLYQTSGASTGGSAVTGPVVDGLPTNPGLADAYLGSCTGAPPQVGTSTSPPLADDASADSDASTDDAGADSGTGAACADDGSCCAFDDLAIALGGMQPTDVWVTRLRANLPSSALATDLYVSATADQSAVSNVLQASRSGTVTATSAQIAPMAPSHTGTLITISGTALAIASMMRRKRSAK